MLGSQGIHTTGTPSPPLSEAQNRHLDLLLLVQCLEHGVLQHILAPLMVHILRCTSSDETHPNSNSQELTDLRVHPFLGSLGRS